MSIGRNIVHLLVWQVLTWIITFLGLIIVPRRLGTDTLGAYGYAAAYVSFFALLAGLGTNTLLVREIARDRSRLSQYVYNATALKALTVAVVPVLGIAIAWLIGNRGDRLVLIVISFVGMAFAALTEVAFGALNGLEIISKPAFLMVVQVYIASGLGVVAVLLGYGVIVLAVIGVIGAFVPMVAGYVMLRPKLRRPVHIDMRIWRFLTRAGIPLMTLTVLNTVYGSIDIPLLGGITNDATVGWYTLAYRWVGIPIFITTAVVSSYFPRFSAHGSPMTPEFPGYVNQAVRLVMLASVPCALGLAMVADDLVHLLYKPDFYPAIPLIRILALHIPLAGMDTVLATALIAANQQRRYLYVALIAAILNPVACIVLINWAATRFDNGAIGASIVTVATELFIMVGALRLKAPGVLDRRSVLHVLRIIAAGLIMVAVLFAIDTAPLGVQVASGAAVYAVAALVVRAVTIDDVRRVGSALPIGRRRNVAEPID